MLPIWPHRLKSQDLEMFTKSHNPGAERCFVTDLDVESTKSNFYTERVEWYLSEECGKGDTGSVNSVT
jgi:hypothetical protein